jgi:CheY-like chemotaxis protein
MKRIIICDDEPHIVEGLRYMLRGPDRTVEVARNGQQALDLIKGSLPDLLIIDVLMPVMTGPEAVARIRESPGGKELPIIILTAKGQAQDAVIAQEVWGAMVLTKPFVPSKLKELVAAILEVGSSAMQSYTA